MELYQTTDSIVGAILADEMGMGKTIELIGLVLANPAGKLPKMEKYIPTKATLSKFGINGVSNGG